MQRISHIVGKPIVSAEQGEQVGKVADVLLDPMTQEIVGLVVAGGLLSSEQVLPFKDVQTFGTDTVVARTAAGVLGPKDWHAERIETSRFSALKDRLVMTDAGRELGRVKDIHLDEQSGVVAGLEVHGRNFSGLVERRSTVPDQAMTIGPDAVIVSDALATPAESAKRR
jgi:uncharacterized protein YrrD